jgi:hypothetical protein
MKKEWLYYYLYSVERVGRILNTELIGRQEWYPLGARQLIDLQEANGAWRGDSYEKDVRLATSFALLFLTRATPTLDAELKRGGSGTLKTAITLPPRLRIYVILDCSGSMLAEMEGKQKFHVAREAVVSLVREMPEGVEMALRVYGHRERAIEDGSSEDTELLLPMGKLEPQVFLGKLEALRARGKTPLARSLLEAREDLTRMGSEEVIRVILLTDGGEDTLPRQDPLKAAGELAGLKNMELHIVGFDINRPDWGEQLQEMARRSRGRYLAAARGEELLRELRSAVLGSPEGFLVLDGQGNEAARGRFGESKVLPEGKYRLRATFAGRTFEEELWINTEAVTWVTFDGSRAPLVRLPSPGPRPPRKPVPPSRPPRRGSQPLRPRSSAPPAASG